MLGGVPLILHIGRHAQGGGVYVIAKLGQDGQAVLQRGAALAALAAVQLQSAHQAVFAFQLLRDLAGKVPAVFAGAGLVIDGAGLHAGGVPLAAQRMALKCAGASAVAHFQAGAVTHVLLPLRIGAHAGEASVSLAGGACVRLGNGTAGSLHQLALGE